MARLVKRPTSAQVTISPFMSSSPASGSMLTAQSLEPASESVSPFPSAPPLLALCLSLSLSKINIKKKKKRKESIFPGVPDWLRACNSWSQGHEFDHHLGLSVYLKKKRYGKSGSHHQPIGSYWNLYSTPLNNRIGILFKHLNIHQDGSYPGS